MGGSPICGHDDSDSILSPVTPSPHQSGAAHITTTNSVSPNSRRTSRLELKDKQWDALFDSVAPKMNNPTENTHKTGGESPSRSPQSSPNASRGRASADKGSKSNLEMAHALAQAKQAANPSRYNMVVVSPRDTPPDTAEQTVLKRKKTHKRKRNSRDDIFRSRKFDSTSRRAAGFVGDGNCMNPISKFLSNHKEFANALCFATPVRDSEEDYEEDDVNEDRHDNNSLASDANTLNTCEDSMLMLDRKLAAMSKNQPPMPLFHDFKVNQEPEGLRRIVNEETHSSAKLIQLWRQSRQQTESPINGGVIVPSSSGSSGSSDDGGEHRGRARIRYPPAQPPIPEEAAPMSMKVSSSGSSSNSSGRRAHVKPEEREI